jgi:4-carboxymuconolactone decarboxylase
MRFADFWKFGRICETMTSFCETQVTRADNNFAAKPTADMIKQIIAAAVALVCAVHMPSYASTTNNIHDNIHDKMDSLNEKQQCLAAIACLEAKGDIAALEKAIAAGLDANLTVSQIKEALSQLYAYTGFPRSLNALGALQRVAAQRKADGCEDAEGRDASPLPDGYDALKQGTEVQTRLVGGKPFTYTFAPATDYYLKAHLFGDIFARDNLTFAERELVTVSALSGLKGVEPQLKSHVSGARNMGLSDGELRAIPGVLRERVGETEAWRAGKAISEILGDEFTEGEPVENMAFPKGEPNVAYAQYFIGNSYLAPLVKDGKLPVSNVTFEPRCRNNWHIHHKGGQILICVGGKGWYQEWGKPAQALKPGDVVNIPAEVKHWHGAAKDSWFQHIAISVPAEGAGSEWLEPVGDEYYDKL